MATNKDIELCCTLPELKETEKEPVNVAEILRDYKENEIILYTTMYGNAFFKGFTRDGGIILENVNTIIRASNPQPIGFSGILLAKRQNSFYCTYFLHNRNVADTKSPYPIKRLEVIRWFNQKSMVFNQSLS